MRADPYKEYKELSSGVGKKRELVERGKLYPSRPSMLHHAMGSTSPRRAPVMDNGTGVRLNM